MLLPVVGFLSTLFIVSTSASSPVSGKQGAVVTEVGQCSDVGIKILKAGGNAADAIIASSLCVGVISAYHSGIGGGGFIIVRYNEKNQHKYKMIDFRETAPAAANKTMYLPPTDPNASKIGGLAVAVPGEIRGWKLFHDNYGSKNVNWTELFKPAIDIARNGFKVNIDLAGELKSDLSFLTEDPLWAEVYAPNGTLLKLGDICYRKRYADTLEKIANFGPDYFYHGEMAANTAEAVYSRGGILTTHDLANYSVIVREPSNITYRKQHRIFSTVSPSSGSIVLSILKIFEGFLGNASMTDPLTTHHLIQATKFGYGQRANLGDPAFTANVSTLENKFLQKSTADAARSKIVDTRTFDAEYYDINNYLVLNDSGTSHLAAADASGMAVSLTTTINLIWGSRVMTTDGIILNDQMDDFSSPNQNNSIGFTASPANHIEPGKRPQSSISSSIVEDVVTGRFVAAAGSAGGIQIITATLQNLYHLLDQGMTPNASVHQARWHDQLSNFTYFETPAPQLGIDGFDNSTVAYLHNIGYKNMTQDNRHSVAHLINRAENGVFTGANDPRRPAGGASAH